MIINDKRALAYIAEVTDISPIEGADNIELAGVLGWKVIVKKGEFNIGDKAIYFEIDSKVPQDDERFAFLEKKKFKIKTMKLGKFNVISQGLLMPRSLFPELEDLELGTDVTEKLRVVYSVDEDNERKGKPNPDAKYMSMKARHKRIFSKKWAKWLMKREWGRKIMFFFFGKKKDNPRSFPTHFTFIHKTDEERFENIPWVLRYKHPLIITEKLDGTSSTYILERKGKKKFEFYVLSRNVRQVDEKQSCYHNHNIYWDMAFKYNIEDHLKKYLEDNPKLKYVCVQGESVGNVQGNPLKLKEDDLYIFNFIDSEKGRYDSISGEKIIESWGMKWVPILDTSFIMPNDMEVFKQMATAQSVINNSVLREGIVLRDPKNNFSFKNVSREYLLKHDQ